MALDRFRKLADCLSERHDSACDCESAYMQFECLAEQAVLGVDIHDLLPLVALHIDRCPDCREEFDALVAIVSADRESRINE